MDDYFLQDRVAKHVHGRLQKIIVGRADLIADYRELIENLSTEKPEDWQHIVAAAREGGLTKEILCSTFSCSWSTVLRWQAGRNAPGAFARAAIKQKLLQLLDERQSAERARLDRLKTSTGRSRTAA